jgi:hypothetical protein
MYISLLPTWGDKVTHDWDEEPVIFDTTNAKHTEHFWQNDMQSNGTSTHDKDKLIQKAKQIMQV